MKKPERDIRTFGRFIKRKTIIAVVSTVLAAGMAVGYFLMPASGTVEEALNGDGAMDSAAQVGAWTLVNAAGISAWDPDDTQMFAGSGSGRLSSSVGADAVFDSYVYYRFTTSDRAPVSVTLDLVYRKNSGTVQPLTGEWDVLAEVWKVGATEPLKTIAIDAGNANIDFTALPSEELNVINEANTQYELRLIQKGVTGSDPAAGMTVWFDEVKINAAYDTTPPAPVSAAAVTDSSADIVFNEKVDRITAENTSNYALTPELAVNTAVLQADGVTVRLQTAAQAKDAGYSIAVNGIKDVSENIMSAEETVSFTGIDTTLPVIVSAVSVNSTAVDVVFSEQLDRTAAENTVNYAIAPELAVSEAALQPDGKTVRLTTQPQGWGTQYTLTVNSVSDVSGNIISGTEGNTVDFAAVDNLPPELMYVTVTNNSTLRLEFGEKVEALTAEDITNYAVTPDMEVNSAALQQDSKTVVLTTAAQTPDVIYTVKVSNIKDLAGNSVGARNSGTFTGAVTDSVPLAVLSASAPNSSRVDVVFSGAVNPYTAQAAANYSISPELSVIEAYLQPDGMTVSLTTGSHTPGQAYTVTVQGVRDPAGNVIDTTQNTAGFNGSAAAVRTPHGSYLDDTNECSKCHITHDGQGQGLISVESVNSLCYLCHDAGGQSRYDTAGQYEINSTSYHDVPQETQRCTDCHNPHDGGQDADGNFIHWPRLLQSSADPGANGGNQFCFSCHRTAQDGARAIEPDNYPATGEGHNDPDFTINGMQPFNGSSGTDITCLGCHDNHGSGISSILKENPNGDAVSVKTNDRNFCYECHNTASSDGRYPGQAVFDRSKHGLVSSLNTNTELPGAAGQAGQCANCHDVHGTADGTSGVRVKTLRGVYNDGKTSFAAADFGICFQCHNESSLNPDYDIQSQYNAPEGGHRIKTAGGTLEVGSVMPCETCHSLHGSANNNKYSLKDNLGVSLGDGRNECLACHQDGKTVVGIAMSPPPQKVGGHRQSSRAACLNCHGSPHNLN
ncbi:cytochrome c3 family protein [Phosphitispora fastidiosa]|uniref:cytochrome c3 family protein n=1 Tax=Phosphitispora fastidiosa TaxID=2837202 RepID=UPI001E430181|nr:cytochrome c3 family protein [Phosphitispora fastidiosa]MBU7006725.1 putative CXXCH cytochrome family protein [Phosphitispora fastidiosa]